MLGNSWFITMKEHDILALPERFCWSYHSSSFRSFGLFYPWFNIWNRFPFDVSSDLYKLRSWSLNIYSHLNQQIITTPFDLFNVSMFCYRHHICLHLYKRSVSIIIKVVGLIAANDGLYTIQLYVIKFVNALR